MPATLKRLSKELNIEIDKGSSETRILVWKSGPKGSESPVDLTGCTARLLVKDILANGNVGTTILADMTTENGGIELGGVTGEVRLKFIDDDTTNYTWSKGAYSLEIYFSNGDTRRLTRGLITAFDEIVR